MKKPRLPRKRQAGFLLRGDREEIATAAEPPRNDNFIGGCGAK